MVAWDSDFQDSLNHKSCYICTRRLGFQMIKILWITSHIWSGLSSGWCYYSFPVCNWTFVVIANLVGFDVWDRARGALLSSGQYYNPLKHTGARVISPEANYSFSFDNLIGCQSHPLSLVRVSICWNLWLGLTRLVRVSDFQDFTTSLADGMRG